MKKTQINKKSMLCIGILLLISCLFIFKKFLFGNQILAYTDIGSDTYDQYLMHYQGIINHLKNGTFSLWDFTNGYGANVYTYNLFDPFLILLYLFGTLFGAEQIYGFLVYWCILHVLLAGMTIYLFLSCFSLSERSKVMAAYLYALCGYMVVWGQHYQFGTVIVLLPLMLMAVERSFEKTRWLLGLTIFCSLAVFSSMYMAYMQFILLGFYVLFRVAWRERLFTKNGIIRVIKTYGSMLMGVGIGMIQLLPSACLILNVSGRVSGDSLITRCIQALQLYPSAYYKSLWNHLFSSNLLGVNEYAGYQNFYEDPQVFLSVILLLALLQFVYLFFVEKFSKKQRVLLILAAGAVGFVLLIPLGSMIFNGFVGAFCRQTFLCMPLAVWLIAYVLDKILEEKKCNLPLLIIGIFLTAGYYLYSYKNGAEIYAVLLGILAVGMGVAIVSYCWVPFKWIQLLSPILLLACIMMTMSGDAYLSYNHNRWTVSKDTEYLAELYDQDVQEALEYLKRTDDTFYRVEKTYTAGTEISCLNAMAQGYYGISTYNSTLNTNLTTWYRLMWPETTVINEAHRSFAAGAGVSLPASLSHVKYVLSDQENFDTEGYSFVKRFGDVYLYQNTYTADLGKFFPGYELGDADEEHLMFLENQPDMSSYSKGIRFSSPKKDSLVQGTATVAQDGVLMLAIPYENGWNVYVDGEKTELYKVNYGFIGVALEAGSHEITCQFRCPGFAAGAWISCGFILLTAAIWGVIPYYKRKRS